MIARLGFVARGGGLRHALGFAEDLHRRCVVGGEPVMHVAASLGVDWEQAAGAVRLLRAHPTLSPERAAVVIMRDWGMDDSDIAEIFGRSVRWARIVREQADEIRRAEPIPEHLEYLDAGLQKGDPSPAEIQERARQIPRRVCGIGGRPGGIRVFVWRGDAALFQSVG